MNQQNTIDSLESLHNTRTDNNETRADYIHNGAFRCAISQGYSSETAYDFAKWALDYCPEMQGFSNLFDYFMSQKD